MTYENRDERAERLCNYLRSLALTLDDHTLTDAAELIEELFVYSVADDEAANALAVNAMSANVKYRHQP
jgi:hypothetical protein